MLGPAEAVVRGEFRPAYEIIGRLKGKRRTLADRERECIDATDALLVCLRQGQAILDTLCWSVTEKQLFEALPESAERHACISPRHQVLGKPIWISSFSTFTG